MCRTLNLSQKVSSKRDSYGTLGHFFFKIYATNLYYYIVCLRYCINYQYFTRRRSLSRLSQALKTKYILNFNNYTTTGPIFYLKVLLNRAQQDLILYFQTPSRGQLLQVRTSIFSKSARNPLIFKEISFINFILSKIEKNPTKPK